MKPIVAAVVAIALSTAGVCWFVLRSSGRTIDGSSDESFCISVDAVRQALPLARQDAFEEAMAALDLAVDQQSKEAKPMAAMIQAASDPGSETRRLRTRVHGMTAEQVIAAGKVAAAKQGAALVEARLHANEALAIATLRSILSAQTQCQASHAIDANANGTGEYAYLGELAGCRSERVKAQVTAPPVLRAAFAKVENSRVLRSGYYFQVFLPDANSAGVAEAPKGGSVAGSVDAAQAETAWCCYAWPSDRGRSGARAFFVNQAGDVLGCDNEKQRYSGSRSVPSFTAAFQRGCARLAGPAAEDADGNDGEHWAVIN